MTRPNILLIILDGVRAKNTSLLGHDRQTTPELNSFANSATAYERAFAPSNWSLPSHTSIFTGYQVPEHRITVQYDTLESGHSIWDQLSFEYGYNTGLFSQNEFIAAEQFGLSAGFNTVVGPVSAREYPFQNATDPSRIELTGAPSRQQIREVVSDSKPLRSLINFATHSLQNTAVRIEDSFVRLPRLPIGPNYRSPAQVHTNEFLDWQASQDGPWAACLNFMDANMMHTPWPAPNQWAGPLQERILREVSNLRWDFHS
ncbi:MAG: sulfatase-like hydrolase/transferase, partial [Halobacteriaceae archaeon]